MAKQVNVSDDSGSTWFTLPGGTGAFNSESEGITDTIFGQTFSSTEIGLINWTISGNAFFKGFAGYLAEIKESGTPTIANGEAMSIVSGKTYAIDDAAKDIWDRVDTVVVYDNAVDHTADVLSIDYLLGRVTFLAAYTVTGAVTVDISYLPMTQLAKGQTYTLTMTAEAIDNTDFATAQANGGYRTFESGLRTVSVELGGVYDSTENAASDLAGRNEIVIEIDPAGDGSTVFRGWFKIQSASQSGDVGALEDESITAQLTVPDDALIGSYFSVRHTATTLSVAVQKVITAFIDEIVIDVQYLPTGVEGESPLNGKEGVSVVTDVSLSGGLSDMNTFVADFQGVGAFSEV